MTDPFSKVKEMFSHNEGGAIDYTHASEDKLREAMERVLSESPTGNRLLKWADQQRVAIKILRGKGVSGYIPENRAVYVLFPSQLSTIPPEKILELGAFLRQAELQISGIKNPDISMGSSDQIKAFDTKIIDNLIIMCKIGDELYEKGTTQFLDALNRMGHSEFYSTYKKYGRSQELVDTYYKFYEKNDEV